MECVDPAYIAWHARSPANETMLGVELTQPNAGDHITDEHLRSLAWWLKIQSERFSFALIEANLPEHRILPAGIADGKSDIGPDYSFARLAPFLT